MEIRDFVTTAIKAMARISKTLQIKFPNVHSKLLPSDHHTRIVLQISKVMLEMARIGSTITATHCFIGSKIMTCSYGRFSLEEIYDRRWCLAV